MKIIALKGGDSTGKSSTLNLVYDDLLFSGATIINLKKGLGNAAQKDFECILIHSSNQLAFYTMGDYAKKTVEAIKKYHLLGVDILIVATNDKFVIPTVEILKYPNVILTKTVASPKNKANNLAANQLDCAIILASI